MKEEVIIVCSTENRTNTTGKKAVCYNCKCDIWVSDSSTNAVKKNHPDIDFKKTPPLTFCMVCGFEKLVSSKSEKEIRLVNPTDEQIEELKNHHNKNKC